MLFTFLKYLQPTHYFQLFRKDGTSVYPKVGGLPDYILEKIPKDPNYSNLLAQEYDRSWRAIRNGYIGPASTYVIFDKLDLVDEYYFIRKYFHPVYSFYVLAMRLISFNNSLMEIGAWKKSRTKVRPGVSPDPLIYTEWNNFQSTLIASEPLVTVIIPTLNRYDHLINILQDFEKQDYKNFEIIIVDQSKPFKKDFYDQFELNLTIIYQEEKALWLARNTAIEKAKGDIIALSEDDVRIPSNWISNHLACLDFFKADISAGVFFPEGATIPLERSYFAISSQLATGNAVLYKRVFKKTGLFDRQFEKQRMGDGEFGLRAYLGGFKSVSNPYAFCLDVKAAKGGLRDMGSWDSFRPKNFFSPRPIPSVLYFYRKYFGLKRTLLSLLKTVPPSIMPYRYKKNRISMVIGSLISLILLPVILLQIILSWRKAGEKLKQGALINELE